ncbi:MAG: sodium-independent anion transporter [Cyclobacteriaceae bacterium]|nr:sodium-independent anion transporter [Cyclobacteriaceae bacterium]
MMKKYCIEEFKDVIYIKHLYGPLFFGFTAHFLNLFKNLDEKIKVLIIRMDRVPHIDQTGLYAMEETLFDLNKKGLQVIIIGLQSQPADMLRSIDIIPDLIPEKQLFDNMDSGFFWLKKELTKDSGSEFWIFRKQNFVSRHIRTNRHITPHKCNRI